jgi:hypothetical protein
MYLLNCYQLISFFPKPATLFTTYWISSSPKLYLICYDILFKSAISSTSFFYTSTNENIAFLPDSLKGFPTFSVINLRKVSKSIHSPFSYWVVASNASYTSLYLRSNPKVLAVLRISETSHCLRLSQYRLNISKKSSQCSLEKTGFFVTNSLAKTVFFSFSASYFLLSNIIL